MELEKIFIIFMGILCYCLNGVYPDNKSATVDDSENKTNSTRLLSRKRRYLTFPEGSSLQLVYDQTIPIVGIELVFTVGVTVALAWELPTEPLYKITQKIRQQILHPEKAAEAEKSRIDKNVTNLEYVDVAQKSDEISNRIDGEASTSTKLDDVVENQNLHKYNSYNYYYTQPSSKIFTDYKTPSTSSSLSSSFYHQPSQTLPSSDKFSYYFNGNKNNNYYSNKSPSNQLNLNGYTVNNKNNIFSTLAAALNGNKGGGGESPSSSLLNNKWNQNNLLGVLGRIAQQYRRNRTSSNWSQNTGTKRKPSVYPLLGKRKKRCVEDIVAEEEEKIFVEHHRRTRHTLYKKIEKYLISHDRDGRSCVLKALCETGQRHHEKGKGTFVGEILRAVFTLPKSKGKTMVDLDLNTKNKKDTGGNHEIPLHYDRAHNHGPEKNCAELYPDCVDSIWSADFIF